jgi:hypothetical protein
LEHKKIERKYSNITVKIPGGSHQENKLIEIQGSITRKENTVKRNTVEKKKKKLE